MANAARVTQLSVEVVAEESSSDNVRITRQYVEYIYVAGSPPATVTQAVSVTIVN